MGGFVVAAVGIFVATVATAEARRVELRDRTPFRNGAGRDTRLLDVLPPATQLEVTTEDRGWLQVTAPDGRIGWVFSTHVRDVPAVAAAAPAEPSSPVAAPELPRPVPPEPIRRVDAEPAAPGVGDELRRLQAEVGALRARLEALEGSVGTLPGTLPAPPRTTGPREGLASMAIAALLVGLVFGWIVSRLARRRTDRRQWNRVRL